MLTAINSERPKVYSYHHVLQEHDRQTTGAVPLTREDGFSLAMSQEARRHRGVLSTPSEVKMA